MAFHVVSSFLLRVLASKTIKQKHLIGCWKIPAIQRVVFEANTRNRKEHTTWKAMKNRARKCYIFLCTINFEVTLPFWKVCANYGPRFFLRLWFDGRRLGQKQPPPWTPVSNPRWRRLSSAWRVREGAGSTSQFPRERSSRPSQSAPPEGEGSNSGKQSRRQWRVPQLPTAAKSSRLVNRRCGATTTIISSLVFFCHEKYHMFRRQCNDPWPLYFSGCEYLTQSEYLP